MFSKNKNNDKISQDQIDLIKTAQEESNKKNSYSFIFQ